MDLNVNLFQPDGSILDESVLGSAAQRFLQLNPPPEVRDWLKSYTGNPTTLGELLLQTLEREEFDAQGKLKPEPIAKQREKYALLKVIREAFFVGNGQVELSNGEKLMLQHRAADHFPMLIFGQIDDYLEGRDNALRGTDVGT